MTTALINEAEELCDLGIHKLGAVVRYMQWKHNLRIKVRSLPTRIKPRFKRLHARSTEPARLLQTLSPDQASETTLRLQEERTGLRHTLCNVWWVYPECPRDYSNYGLVSGTSIDCKALANR